MLWTGLTCQRGHYVVDGAYLSKRTLFCGRGLLVKEDIMLRTGLTCQKGHYVEDGAYLSKRTLC